MTFAQLEKAITAAHRAGDFRAVDDLETERAQRIAAAQERDEMKAERGFDVHRRSFSG